MKYNPDRHNRRSIRLQGYDYANAGMYFVTICCLNREYLLGKIINGKMILNDYGNIATQCWHSIPQHFPCVILHEHIIMPNHLHGIIEIKNGIAAITAEQPRQMKNAFQKIIPYSIGSIIRGFKIGVTKQLGYSIWQRNYHERIIRNETAYTKITGYIRNNPILWKKDCFNNGKI